MATINTFSDILAWQKARRLSLEIYTLTQGGRFVRDFALKDQINRSTGSTMDNIAEGFDRGSKNEFVNFLTYARGSAGETLSQLYRALDRQYITEEQFDHLKDQTDEIGKLLTGLISYLNHSTIAGFKFKGRK